MRLVKISWRPAAYMSGRYGARPEARGWSYADQRAWLYSDFWGTTNAWETYLPPFGYETTDIIAGAAELNAAWWRDHGAGPQPGADAVLAAQLAKADPEILVIEGIERYTASRIHALRALCPNLRLTILTTGTEIDYDALLPAGDIFLVRIPHMVPVLRAKGYDVELFRHAFDRRVLEKVGTPRKEVPLSFIGSIFFGRHFHDRRYAVLAAVAKELPLTLFTDSLPPLPGALKTFARDAVAAMLSPLMPRGEIAGRLGQVVSAIRARKGFPVLQYDPVLSRHAVPAVYGLDMYRKLAASFVTLNVQPEIGMGSATNMRLYEATGMGACLFTDAADDLAELFVPDEEVVAYASTAELIEKLRAMLDKPDLAVEIGRRAQLRVLKDHSYEARFAFLDQVIRRKLGA